MLFEGLLFPDFSAEAVPLLLPAEEDEEEDVGGVFDEEVAPKMGDLTPFFSLVDDFPPPIKAENPLGFSNEGWICV